MCTTTVVVAGSFTDKAFAAMPLDERPRPSVANLVGRFEKETKRLSVSTSSPSRSSSVVSHITNDSAKEELKEKREWPPRAEPLPERQVVLPPGYVRPQISTASDSTLTLGSTAHRSKKETPEDNAPETPLTAKALDATIASNPEPATTLVENWRKEVPEGQPADVQTVDVPPVEADLPTPTPVTTKKFTGPPPRTPAATRTTAPKSTPAATSKAALASKTPQKAPPAPKATPRSTAPPVTQALKPQHTGQSTTSAASARRPTTKPPVPPVSIRAKTPSRPDPSRSKTPTSAVPRAKTPSTGLFAPTAASLARSRSAVPPVPTPVKKATLSTDVMDRLSKPTAASLSKTRSLNPEQTPVSPPRSAKAAPKSATLAGSTSKQPISASSSKTSIKGKATTAAPPKTPLKKQPVSSTKATSAAAAAASATGAAPSAKEEEQAHGLIEKPTDAIEDVTATSDVKSDASAASRSIEDDHHGVEEDVEVEVEDREHVEDNEITVKSPITNPGDISISSELSDLTQLSDEADASAAPAPKDDLLDIVNMLEGTSIKPSGTKSGDEILEIPDEDDR